ncbi:MAG TPA: hypothetical protein VF430_04975 [Verrucomicrobiae bacterium]|jgi:hypothetical protein
MKPLAGSVMLGVAGLLVAALFAAAALTNGEPPLISPLFVAGSTNLGLAPINSAPIAYLDGKAEHSERLKPGVYQTRPYAIILIVPESGIDDRCVEKASGDISKMRNSKPDLQAVPKNLSR